MTGRVNFFLLLELDPAARWSEEAFQHAFAARRNAWTRAATGPKTLAGTVEAKRNLNLLREITRVMGDAEAREAERKGAEKEKRAALEAARRELKDRLDLLELRGHLLLSERDGLRDDFAEVLASSPALARRLDAVEVKDPGPAVPADRLDEHAERQLRELLRTAQLSSLYEVLKTVDESVTERSPVTVLVAAAERLYLREHQRKNKSDPAVKAREDLSGHAKKHFATEEGRRRHDASMRLESLRELVAWYTEVLGTARAMTAAQVEDFLVKAKRRGVRDLDLALGFLRDDLTARRWALELPGPKAAEEVDRLVHCPRCGELNEPEASVCAHCAFSLRDPCPACGRVEPRRGGCRCGFPVGLRERVEDLLTEAAEAADAGRGEEAAALLDRAARIWRLPATSADPLAARLRDARLRLAQGAERLSRLAADIAVLSEARRFVEVSRMLQTAPVGLPDRDASLARAEEILARVRRLSEQARRPGLDRVRRVDLLSEALSLCEDYAPARSDLMRIPPEPPRVARAAAEDVETGVLVTWTETGESGVSYVIVRGTGPEPPNTPEDLPGRRRVAKTDGGSWRDRPDDESVGVPLTYAVFAVRFGAFSAPAVAAPVLVTADPELTCRAGEGEVEVSWRPPRRCDRMEIVRERVGSADPPVRLPSEGVGHVDRDLVNGAVYRYTARARFAGYGGAPVWSQGRMVEISPRSRPTPPGPLAVTGAAGAYLYSHRVELRVPEPDRGVVRIISQSGAGSLREGDAADEAGFQPGGRILPGTSSPFVDLVTSPDDRFFTYVPVLIVDGRVHVGKVRRYVTDPDVAGLAVEFDGDRALLGWTWPSGGRRALVGWSAEGAIADIMACQNTQVVPRSEGEAHGGCFLRVPADTARLHVMVALTVAHAQTEFATSGVSAAAARPAEGIRYEVTAARRRAELVLVADAPLDLPALTLVARPDREPATRADGEVVLALPPSRAAVRTRYALPRSPGLHHRLFTADPSDAERVELRKGAV
ncbi:hypothetical protein GCM10022221_44120 [Actinocorallia aurea]